jgi:hypothetical protein
MYFQLLQLVLFVQALAGSPLPNRIMYISAPESVPMAFEMNDDQGREKYVFFIWALLVFFSLLIFFLYRRGLKA